MSGIIGSDSPRHPGYRSGRYYCSYVHTAATNNAAVAADTIYFYPIEIKAAVVIDGLAIRVGTAVPSTNVKLALYDNLNGVAGTKTLLASSASAGDMNETAGNTISLDFVTPYKAIPGFYWGAALFNGSAQPSTHTNAISLAGLGDIVGGVDMTTYAVATALNRVIVTSNLYASGFPDIAAAPTISANNVSPIIGWYPL
jgi:hypothetical protein